MQELIRRWPDPAAKRAQAWGPMDLIGRESAVPPLLHMTSGTHAALDHELRKAGRWEAVLQLEA